MVKRSQEANRTGDVIENQQALFVIQDRVVVRQAAIISDIVERFQYRDAGLEGARRHF